MAFELHTVEVPSGLNAFSRTDRVILGSVAIPYGAAAAGASSTADGRSRSTRRASCCRTSRAFLTAQTPLSFTVQIQNRLATVALSAGTIGALIVN